MSEFQKYRDEDYIRVADSLEAVADNWGETGICLSEHSPGTHGAHRLLLRKALNSALSQDNNSPRHISGLHRVAEAGVIIASSMSFFKAATAGYNGLSQQAMRDMVGSSDEFTAYVRPLAMLDPTVTRDSEDDLCLGKMPNGQYHKKPDDYVTYRYPSYTIKDGQFTIPSYKSVIKSNIHDGKKRPNYQVGTRCPALAVGALRRVHEASSTICLKDPRLADSTWERFARIRESEKTV